MSKADELFEEIQKLPLHELLTLCALALETNMDKDRSDVLLKILEMRLEKRRTLESLGMSES